MVLSISGTVSAQPAYAPSPAPAATQQAPKPQASDTVTLSLSAQVSQLRIQGQGPSQIAEALGIPVSTVNSDLGIVATNVASQPAAAQPAT
jgi:DNA-directed RNA polymerase specialized sigma24 family protein